MNKIKKKIQKTDLIKIIIRAQLLQGSWNFERMQALGFCFSILPIIKKLYKNNNKKKIKCINRHLKFFNTHPYVVTLIIGIVLAMEEQKSNGISIKSKNINNIKIGLMGPLAGVGDPIFWGIIRPILSALTAGFAISGNIVGPIMFFTLFNIIRIFTQYYGIKYGYNKGTKIINNINKGIINKITEGSSIIGLFVMGGLVNKWTHINIPIKLNTINKVSGIQIITVQNILDQITPGILSLLITLICMWLLNKKINSIWIIISFFIIGIIGYQIGLLGL